MNHPFVASLTNPNSCASCKKDMLSHTNEAICECCTNIGVVELYYGNLLMCAACKKRDDDATALSNDPVVQQTRVDTANGILETIRAESVVTKAIAIDNAITVRTELFNAETLAIEEVRKSILEDVLIVNKPLALAEFVKNRIENYQRVIFEMNEQVQIEYNKQIATQTYLNNLANQLRKEEREKLKISDISYNPNPPKLAKEKLPTVSKPKKVKLDKALVAKIARELGIGSFMVETICTARGVTPEMAKLIIQESLDSAKGK